MSASTRSSKNRISIGQKHLLGILVSSVLVVLAYRGIDFSLLFSMLGRISLPVAILAITLHALSQLISAVKWRLFLSAAGFKRSVRETVEAYFAGMFVNSFGLGTLGGDATRSLLIRPKPGERSIALGTVIADRLHGLFVLLCIAMVGLLLAKQVVGREISLIIAAPAALSLLATWFLVVWYRETAGFDRLVERFGKLGQLAQRAASGIPRTIGVILPASLVSALVHLLQIVVHFIVARQLGIEVPFVCFLAIVPLANIAISLPISVGGLGVREAFFVAMFTPLGVAHEAAIAHGAICLLVVSLVNAAGGLWSAHGVSDELLSRREISPSRAAT